MATITTDTFLDSLTRVAGESMTMSGGVLTIRTDTRGGTGAPAAMTGSLGAQTISATLGGGVLIDARNVRQVAYNTGGGVVPAIGTSITQGGVSGYLLGVYSAANAAPTAVGAAMPASGFLKFREVTGGSFAAGALGGITATATGADVTSWIEVVCDQSIAITVPRLGFYRTRGDWFYLDNTTGSAGQIIQVPTNGGGSGTHVAGVWIETGVGTNAYEFYPAVLAAVMIAANFGTDARSKFVETMGDGRIRIGNNGTTNVCFVPPAGCRVRVANIFFRQCTTGARASNAAPNATLGTRPDFTTTSAGVIDFEYVMSDWYHLFASPFEVKHTNVAVFDGLTVSNAAAPLVISECHIGNHLGTSVGLTLTACSLGGTITDSSWFRVTAGANLYSASIATSDGITFTRNKFGVIANARNASGYALYSNQSLNLVFNQCTQYNQNFYFNTSFNIEINDIDHVDRFVGTTNTTTPLYVVQVYNSSDNVLVDGVTFGLGGTIANVHPYNGVFNAQNSSNIRFRNLGTRAAPVSGGSANQVGTIYVDSGVNTNVAVQRCYLTATRSNILSGANTSKKMTAESVHGTTGSVVTASLNSINKGVRATDNSVTGQASVYGTHFNDMFTSNTAGRIWWAMNEPTADSSAYVTLTLAGATGGFTSGGQVSMPTLNDQLILETPYRILGHTALANVAPTLTGTNTGNFSYEYQIDTGSGFGSYKTLNATNLSGETINPADGFKLRLRITCTVAATTNALTYVRIDTVSTLVAQTNNLYPLDVVDVDYSLTGLDVGTEVVLLNSSNSQIDRQTIATSTYTYSYQWTGTDLTGVYALIWKGDRNPIKLTGITLSSANQSVPITQTDDLIYTTAATNATVDFANELIIMNTGATEYNVPAIYSLWKDSILLTTNAQYQFAFNGIGGNPTGGSNSIPFYTFLVNGWKVRPQEANHTLRVTQGILLVDGGGDPFVNTTGSFVVRINYEQPVQAIAVSTSGSSLTAQDVWDYLASNPTTANSMKEYVEKIRGNTNLIPATL